MASKKDVRDAFKLFDRLGLHLPKSDLFKSPIEQREVMSDDWAELFCDVEPWLFHAAAKVAVKKCKFWPSPAEMMAAIDELRPDDAKVNRYPVIPSVKGRALDPAVRSMIDQVLRGHEFAQELPIDQDVIDVAREYFPDIGMDLIRKNYCEFRQLADQKKTSLAEQFGEVVQGSAWVPRLDRYGHVVMAVARQAKSECV